MDIAREINVVLDILNGSEKPHDANFAGIRFDDWLEDGKPRYGVSLSDRWLISFSWNGQDAIEVDLELVN